MTVGLLLLAGATGHVMQNGSAMAEQWLGIEFAAHPPVVATREPRLIGYGGAVRAAPLPATDDAVRRMDVAPPLITDRQPGLAGLTAMALVP